MRSLRWVSMAFVMAVGLVSGTVASADKKEAAVEACKKALISNGMTKGQAQSICTPTDPKDALFVKVTGARQVRASGIPSLYVPYRKFLAENGPASKTCEDILFDTAKKCLVPRTPGKSQAPCETFVELTREDAQFACTEIELGYLPSQVYLGQLGELRRSQVKHCESVLTTKLEQKQAGPYCSKKGAVHVHPEAFLACINTRLNNKSDSTAELAAQSCLD